MARKVTVHILIYGRVQGVAFRYIARDEAKKLGLLGWVRNNEGGSVEAQAVGPKNKLEEFINWCKKGPTLAKVERVKVEWNKEDEDFDDFSIRFD